MFRPTLFNRLATFATRPFQQIANFNIPTGSRKIIPVYPPVESRGEKAIDIYQEQCLEKLDPEGWRRLLVSPKSRKRLLAGDIIRIVYTTRQIPQFMGQIIGINRGGIDTSILLRNKITKTGVEMRVKIFSPLIQRIDVIKKPIKRNHRNKQYYIRGTRLDVGDLEADLKKLKRKTMRRK